MLENVYQGQKTREISFPLGGIGAGSVGLSGNGMLIDWEIFNKPSKGSTNGFTHFAIKAERRGEVLDARVLSGDLQAPYSGEYAIPHYGFGYGVKRERMTGMPGFPQTSFQGQYPVATVRYSAEKFPGDVELAAFAPFIPLNDRDSSIPAAFFEFTVCNPLAEEIDYTLAFSCKNPFVNGTSVNGYFEEGGVKYIRLGTTAGDKADPTYGDLTIATDCDDAGYQQYWFRGRFFDELGTFWKDFTAPGKLRNRQYTENPPMRSLFGSIVYAEDTATLTATVKAAPGESRKIRFVLSWSFPNVRNTWRPVQIPCEPTPEGYVEPSPVWKNYYHTLFEDSAAAALYCMGNFARLHAQTEEFRAALFHSTLPPEVKDAVSANLSTLKSPSCLRLENGAFYSFEGCNCTFGSCEGSCTHVLNYAYALPFLFPALERSLRETEYAFNLRDSGSMAFRVNIPLGGPRWYFRACVDGQFGTVLKVYREWKISGDTAWLKGLWERVKKSLEFAWSPGNPDRWDADRDGVLEGCQHHTLDMELFGPNAWLTGFYLAALKAGSEMAAALGEADTAGEYAKLFERGSAWVDDNLFNGEYYVQKIDVKDKSILEPYRNSRTAYGELFETGYWNGESGEIKYQLGDGCMIDQVIAQWHANNCGLGRIYSQDHVKKALRSIYKYNFKKSMRDFMNPCRVCCLYDEAGAVICQWPKGGKPDVPAPYSQEVFNGMEYQAACHMIQEGFVEEGLELVRAVRDRYDGEKRNPWNEFESGSNYVRSMSSYALLNAYSGFEYHMAEGMIGFNPIRGAGKFECMWSLGPGWGVISCGDDAMELKVLGGAVGLRTFNSGIIAAGTVHAVTLCGKPVGFRQSGRSVLLSDGLEIKTGDVLRILFTPNALEERGETQC
jgi:non-lysosomal glucosylceramidase